MRTIIFLLFSNVLVGQVHNSQFEQWDLYNGREKPKEWYCPNLCPSTACGPCDKIEQDPGEYAVRIHNVMPCVSPDNQAKSRSAGFIQDIFPATSNHFKISFDLIIDSIEIPAELIFTMNGGKQNGLPFQLVWKTDSIQSQKIEHEIKLDEVPDSFFIELKVAGYLKQNPLHDCDKGYLSAIIDNLETKDLVSTKDISRSDIHVFPNPFINTLNIKSDFPIDSWILFDPLGHSIMSGKSNELYGLNTLAKGLYLIQIMTGTKIIFEKVIKE